MITNQRGAPRRITVWAPAKVNLDLRILSRRPDGYHELRTILQSIVLRDTLSLRARRGPLTIRSRTSWVPQDEANVIWKAACGLWRALRRSGTPQDVAITIRKVIPTEAGLGGGSSDAAAALRGLSALWAEPADDTILAKVAARVGSDVPFFLTGGTALGTGCGEKVHHLEQLHRHWVVLAKPSYGVPTADAYRWWDTIETGSARSPRTRVGWPTRLGSLGNDLERPVTARHPEIKLVVDRLRVKGALLAAMSGSGSAVFGLFARRDAAVTARLAVRRAGWRTILTRTMAGGEFARVARVRIG